MIQQTKNLKENLKECGIKTSCKVTRHYFNRHQYEFGKATAFFDCDFPTFKKVCHHDGIKITSAWAHKGKISLGVENGFEDVQEKIEIMTVNKFEKRRDEILNLTKEF